MERYTKKDAENAFDRLCRYMGKRVATSYNDVGAWRLDSNPTYGGYVVEEISNDQGGVRHPFGPTRRNARDFYETVHFLRDVLHEQNKGYFGDLLTVALGARNYLDALPTECRPDPQWMVPLDAALDKASTIARIV